MASQTPQASAPARHRVACIDDEPALLSALQRVLAKEPVTVVTFQDPVQALAEIPKGEFALIVSDNQMPGMTGMELMTRLRDAQPSTRRVLLTGATDMSAAAEAVNAGILHGWLNKPWNRDQLIELVRGELARYEAAVTREESGT